MFSHLLMYQIIYCQQFILDFIFGELLRKIFYTVVLKMNIKKTKVMLNNYI